MRAPARSALFRTVTWFNVSRTGRNSRIRHLCREPGFKRQQLSGRPLRDEFGHRTIRKLHLEGRLARTANDPGTAKVHGTKDRIHLANPPILELEETVTSRT